MRIFTSWLAAGILLTAGAGGGPVRAGATSSTLGNPITLVNGTNERWRIRPLRLFGYRTTVALTPADGSARKLETDFSEEVPPTLELPPRSELQFQHQGVRDRWFDACFELELDGAVWPNGEPRAGLYVTYESWPMFYDRSRFKTILGGFVYHGDEVLKRFRFRRPGGSTLVLEPLPEGDAAQTGCLSLP
jgi:hypothetical protein